jgi:glutamate racemase
VLAIDSGIGGLGIVAAIRRAVPGVAVTFVADHGFYPYGRRSDAELTRRLIAIVGHAVAAHPPDLVVIACNTASTIALEALRATFGLPFVGTVPPVKWAASISRTRTIGLLATEATVGRAYVRGLQERFAPDCRLLAYGARTLADIAEARFAGQSVTAGAVEREVAHLFGGEGGEAIDAVCLGCTHYSLLLPELREAGPAHVAWLDPAVAVARRTKDLLDGLAPGSGSAIDRALVTAEPTPGLRAGLVRCGFERVEVPSWA